MGPISSILLNPPAKQVQQPSLQLPEGQPKFTPTEISSSAREVALQRTPLSGSQASDAIREAYAQKFGENPSEENLAILTAQWAHESGRGAKMFNFNFGGIKGTSPEGMTVSAKTHEGFGKNQIQIRDHFRGYSSATEGARDYINLLERRFPEALEGAKDGDVSAFVDGLAKRHYFTANPADYEKAVKRLANEALNGGFDAIGSTGSVTELTGIRDYFPSTRALSSSPQMAVASGGKHSLSFPSSELWNDSLTQMDIAMSAIRMSGSRSHRDDES